MTESETVMMDESADTAGTLSAELLKLKQRHASALAELQNSAANLEAELRALEASAREIESRRIEAQAELSLATDDLHRETEEAHLERRRTVLNRLRRDARAIVKAMASSDGLNVLKSERDTLLESNAQLARSYEEYLEGKELLAKFDPVPGYLLVAHRELEDRVAQVIALDEKIKNTHQPAFTLGLDSLLYSGARTLHVALPIDLRDAEENTHIAALRDSLAENVWTALVETIRYSNERPIDFQQDVWQEYLCLCIVFDSDIEAATLARQFTGYLVQAFENLDSLPFRMRLSTTLVDDEIWLQVNEAEASTEAWSGITAQFDEEEAAPAGRASALARAFEAAPDFDEETAVGAPTVPIGSSSPVPDEPAIPEGIVNDFFTRRDLVSWNRPLRAAQQSKWNQRARRIRTLLLRMAGEGMIGADSHVRREMLLDELPERDRDDLAHAIEMMTAVGFLNEVEDSEESLLAIAPDRLEEIASLINRDVTEGWIGILRQT